MEQARKQQILEKVAKLSGEMMARGAELLSGFSPKVRRLALRGRSLKPNAAPELAAELERARAALHNPKHWSSAQNQSLSRLTQGRAASRQIGENVQAGRLMPKQRKNVRRLVAAGKQAKQKETAAVGRAQQRATQATQEARPLASAANDLKSQVVSDFKPPRDSKLLRGIGYGAAGAAGAGGLGYLAFGRRRSQAQPGY